MDLMEAWVTLTRETGISQKDWLDILALPEPAMRQLFATYAHMDWTKPGTPAWSLVVKALPIVGQAVSLIGGAAIAGAVLSGAPVMVPP